MTLHITRRPATRGGCFLAAIITATSVPVSVQAQPGEDVIGVVTAVHGVWTRPRFPADALGPGRSIQRGDTLRIQSAHTPRKRIAVVFHNGARVSFTCPGSGACPAFVPADSLRESRLPARALAALRGALGLFGSPERLRAYGYSRGGGPALQEAVLQVETNGVDISAALADLEEGSYHARLLPVAPRDGTRPVPEVPVQPFQFTWEPEAPRAWVPVPGLSPGLYTLHLSLTGDSPATSDAWVLLVRDAREREHFADAFEQVRSVVRGWQGADMEELRTVLRAVLDYLAGHPGTPIAAPTAPKS